MAKTVREIINREFFSLRGEDSAKSALGGMLALGITAAPVLDESWHPIGIISLRDLIEPSREYPVVELMSKPPKTVRADANIVEAGKKLGDSPFRHLVVVDDRGVAIGVLSAVDLVRALVGLPAHHPATFPHLDLESGHTWTDDTALDLDHVLTIAPSSPGTLLLVHGAPMQEERVVWIEKCDDVRGRLLDMLAFPDKQEPSLRVWIERGLAHLRFRATPSATP